MTGGWFFIKTFNLIDLTNHMEESLKKHLHGIFEGRRKGPYYVSLGVTSSCNLSCAMCHRDLVSKLNMGYDKNFNRVLLNQLRVEPEVSDKLLTYKKWKIGSAWKKDFEDLLVKNERPVGIIRKLAHYYKKNRNPSQRVELAESVLETARTRLYHWFMDDIPVSKGVSVLNECADMGAREVSLAGGGEPFMDWPRLKEYMGVVKKRTMRGGVTTNATLIDDDKAKFVVDNDWD